MVEGNKNSRIVARLIVIRATKSRIFHRIKVASEIARTREDLFSLREDRS